jgi:peptidyl-prolyl cis-trans isomerase C
MSGCGSHDGGGCACAAARAAAEPVARVNGVPLHAAGEQLDQDTLRQRACTELLRQEAQMRGLLDPDDGPATDGATSAAATAAIERLLDAELRLPAPDDAACRRHFEAHKAQYAHGECVQARHILFAVTPGVDVQALRQHAEGVLVEVRADPAVFAERAARLSNCPSGAQGGDLGTLNREACAPEFARELFGSAEVGVLPRLVHSRFGLHVVEVLARTAGEQPAFEQVRGAVAQALQQQAFATALRQYLQQLAGRASLDGVALDAAATPLVQ